MGFFSWRTSDTQRSIANNYSERSTFPVVMIDDKGNTFVETDYEGYGVFGGKDFYQLVAEMNNPQECNSNEDHDRSIGINIVFDNNPSGDITMDRKMEVKVPVIVERSQIEHLGLDNKEAMASVWRANEPPIGCEYQGYFYDNESDEDNWW